MKRILLILISVSFLFSSCVKDDEKLFPLSPSERMEQSITGGKSVLKTAANGWKVEYFPSPTQEYGGYNLFMKFGDQSKVTVASELAAADYTEDSFYDLTTDDGPVLTFNTYNSLLHYFSQPRNPDGIGPEDSGMRGDYEFIILNASQDSVILKGKKTGNRIKMTPIPANVTWKDYISSMKQAYADMTYPKYIYVVGSDTVSVNISHRKFTFTWVESGETKTVTAPFVPTLTGFKMYSVLDVKGVKVTELIFDKDREVFNPSNGAQAKLLPAELLLNEFFVYFPWYIKTGTGQIGTTTTLYWAMTKSGLTGIGEELEYAYMGPSGGVYGINFASREDAATVYEGKLYFTYNLIGSDEVKLVFASDGDDNGAWYYNYANFNYFISPFNNKTFSLTADDITNPAWIKLQDKSSSSNFMIMYKAPVIKPFN